MIFFPSENYMAIRQQNGLIRHTFVLFIIHLSLLSFLHYKALHGWCQGLNKTSSTYVEEKHTCFHITECTISKVIFKTRIQKVSILFIFKAMISTNLSQQSKPLLRQRPSQGGLQHLTGQYYCLHTSSWSPQQTDGRHQFYFCCCQWLYLVQVIFW